MIEVDDGRYERHGRKKSLERETGFEPATNGLGSRDSTTELLPLSGRSITLAAERGRWRNSHHAVIKKDRRAWNGWSSAAHVADSLG